MSDQAKQMTDDEAAEFAEQVFDVARKGDAAMLAALLSKGLPANFRNHNGDTLLMLAAYHGHAEAVKVLLEFKADPLIANDKNQLPIAGAAFKGNLPVVKAVIDEIGAQKGSEYELGLLHEVIDRRYQLVLPTVVVSNLPANALDQFIGDRALDRLRQNGGQAVGFSWSSMRATA